MSIYTEEGYTSRRDYLENLADDLGVDRAEVFAMADILGRDEDFDGLVTACEDRAAEIEHKTARTIQLTPEQADELTRAMQWPEDLEQFDRTAQPTNLTEIKI